MKIVIAIGGSILLKEYDCKKFQEYSAILKDLSKEHELFVVVGGGKPAREYIGVVRDLGAGEAQCDDIGIEVTRINARRKRNRTKIKCGRSANKSIRRRK